MKKILHILFALALMLSIGIFSVHAVTQSGYDSTNFNFSNFDFSGYVQNDVYKWKCDNTTGTCSKVKQASVNATGYYDKEADCTKACTKTSASSTAGGSTMGLSGNFSFNSDMYNTGSTKTTPNTTPKYQSGSGLSGFDFSAGSTDSKIQGQANKPNVSTNSLNGLNGLNFSNFGTDTKPTTTGGLNSTNLFGTGVQFGNDSGLKLQGTESKPTGNFFTNLISGLGFGNTKLSVNEDQPKPLSTPTESAFTVTATPTEIKNQEDAEITVNWNAGEKGFKTCRINFAVNDSWKSTTKIDVKGPVKVSINYTKLNLRENNGYKNIVFRISCAKEDGTSSQSQAEVKFWSPTKSEEGDKTIVFTSTTPTKWDGTKSTSTLEWNATNFDKCETSSVKNVDGWPPKTLGLSGKQEVTFNAIGEYKFTINCTPKTGSVVSKDVTVKITKESEPEKPGKELSQEAKKQINNDCKISITKLGSDNGTVNSKTTKLVADVMFICEGNPIVDNGADTKFGYDAKPFEYGLYIDIYNLNNNGKATINCNVTPTGTSTIVAKTGEKKEGLVCTIPAGKISIEDDAKIIKAVAYVDYKTNEITGTYYGSEHTVRKTVTGTSISKIDSNIPPPADNSGKEMKIEAVVNPSDGKDSRTFKDCKGGTVKITWSSKNYDACSISSSTLTSIEGSGKEGSKEFKVSENTKKEIIHPIISLICNYLKDSKPTKDVKDVQINIPVCVGDEGDNQTTTIKEKCDATPCVSKYSLGSQVVLKYNDKKIINSSDLKFNVKLSGDKCDLNIFQSVSKEHGKTFARIKIDGKIIQDMTIPADTKERTFTIGNIWNQLSEQTQKNIENTLAKYDAALVNVSLETWSTFDETKGKTWNCNWTPEMVKVTFIKQTSESGGGSDTVGKDKVTLCKEQCKKDSDNLSEKEMVAKYEGSTKSEAYLNCIAKCDNKQIPFPKQKYADKCTTQLSSSATSYDLDNPININVNLIPTREGVVIRMMRGVILANKYVNEQIELGEKDMQGDYSRTYSTFVGKLPEKFLVRSNPKNILKTAIDNTASHEIVVPVRVTTWVGERGSLAEIQCDEQTINITLTSKTSKDEKSLEKGKVTMKCVNCDQCFSGEIFQKTSIGWHSYKLDIFNANKMNSYFVNGTTDLSEGTYRIVINGCDRTRISGATSLNNGWTQGDVVKGFAFSNIFDVKAGQTTNLGTLTLQKAATITPKVTLLDDQGNPIYYTTASKLYLYFAVNGYAEPNNSASITVTKDSDTYSCKLYINNTEITQKPLKQINGGSGPNNKSQSAIKTDYNANDGKYEVFYRCISNKDSSLKVASNIATVVIKK